jgi:ADP-ribosylglycohydrolase
MMSEALQRTLVSLEGLAIGDALGEMLSYRCESVHEIIGSGHLPPKPWWRTDDTEMALGLVETLYKLGHIDQDVLAHRFAERYYREPDRGYGSMASKILSRIWYGEDWRSVSRQAFGGTGSMGNGSAMRVPPLGAWFADDISKAASEAAKSAEVTHLHAEGIAGAIAVAVAAAYVWQQRGSKAESVAKEVFEIAYKFTPDGETRRGIAKAQNLPLVVAPHTAAKLLGNGSAVTTVDTVPYVLWSAARNLDDYKQAIMDTISGEGDCDTNAAMVGGIVALRVGLDGIPAEWRECREPYKLQGITH